MDTTVVNSPVIIEVTNTAFKVFSCAAFLFLIFIVLQEYLGIFGGNKNAKPK